MAKHCDVCNRWYADRFASCPHCAATSGASDRLSDSMLHVELAGNLAAARVPPGSASEIDLDLDAHMGPAGIRPPSESEVNLGERGRPTHHVPARGSESEIEIALPPARVPDTNSGVPIYLHESAAADSRVQWGSLLADATQRETSGLRIDAPSDADLIVAAQAASASHASRIGGAVGSEISAVNWSAPAADARTSGADLGRESVSSFPPDQSGCLPATAEGGTESPSSMQPEPHRRSDPSGPQAHRPARRTKHRVAIDEHFSSDDESAVDLGGAATRPSDADIQPPASASVASQGRQIGEEGEGSWGATRDSEIRTEAAAGSGPRLLAGAAVGLVLGLAASAGLMFGAPGTLANLGVEIGKPREKTASDEPGAGPTALLDADQVAQRIAQLEQEKKDAERLAADFAEVSRRAQNQNSGDLADKLKAADTKAAELAEQVKAAEKKSAELALKLKQDEDKTAAMSTALRAAQEAQVQAEKRAEEEQATAQLAREQAAKADAARREAVEETTTIKDWADKLQQERADAAKQPEASAAARRQEKAATQPEISRAQPGREEPHAGSPDASFATGLQLYWTGAYARAEEWFADAVRRNARDARYHYYLGLSRWSQSRPSEARRDFERAAALEKQNSPSREAVNAVLERIQGGLRQELDFYRK